ncbi:aldo/keto reductase [bacterium]|nr:aldo/keto reductase [bacterium]
MKTAIFGRTQVEVSQIGAGTWTMGSMWGPRDDREAINSLVKALNLGITFIDTAWIYGEGHSESLIASAFRESKKRVFVATKVPPKNMQWPARHHVPVSETFPANHIIEYTEKSLKNLRMEQVDLQQLHVWSDNWLEQGDWMSAIEKLKRDGKIKYFGVSINDHEPNSALKIVESGLIDSVQVIYNIFDQSPEEKLFPLCQKMNVAVIARVPFDEGSLAGALSPGLTFHAKDWRKHYFTKERIPETIEHVEKVKKIAATENLNLPMLALKFCLAHPAVSVVIPGMRKIPHVEANVKAGDGKALSQQTLAALKKEIWLRNFYPSHG